MLLASCEKSNQPISVEETQKIKNYPFNSSIDVGISPISGLFNLRFPVALFDGSAVSVSGEGLDDITHKLSGYKSYYSKEINKIPNARLVPFYVYIYPLENFDNTVALRKITQIDIADGTIVNCEVRLHTIPYENELDVRFGNCSNQHCYDNYEGGNSFITESSLSTMYLETNFDSITIKRVYFAYGNLTFGDRFEIFMEDYDRNLMVPNISIPDTENINYIVQKKGNIWFDFSVKAVDNNKEILGDSMMIDYTLSNNPNHVYSVVSNSYSFINFN